MCNRSIKKIFGVLIAILLFCICSPYNYAQEQETTYSLSAYFGLGYTRFVSDLNYTELNKNGYSGTLRIMWEPEHLLSVGIESGYLHLYTLDEQQVTFPEASFKITSQLSGVPINAIVAMRISDNFRLSVGTGGIILISRVDALGNVVSSTQFSIDMTAGISYLYPLSSALYLGGEMKFYFISKIEDRDLTFQLSLRYKFLSY